MDFGALTSFIMMVSRSKWVLTYLLICTLQVHSMPTSATNFKDPAFGPYFELSTRQSLKPTTTIDYDQADFDEFSNDPGLYDVVGSPDTVNPDPDADQGLDYPGSVDTGVAPSFFEPLYTKVPNGVTPARGSGGISDEDRAIFGPSNRYKPGNGQAYATTKPGNDQNEPQIDGDNDNVSPDKQISSTENAKQESSSTKSANGSNKRNSIENGTESEHHTTNDLDQTTTEMQPNGHGEGSSITPHSDNRFSNQPIGENVSKENSEANMPTKIDQVQSNRKWNSDYKLNNNGHDTDESSSRDVSSESTSRDISSPNDSESYETKFASVSSSENSGGSASKSASDESFERRSGETSSGENPTYRNKQNPSSRADITTENDITRDEMLDIGSAETSKSRDMSDDANSRMYDASTSNESGNSASDETGSSTSNGSGSETSGQETSGEGGNSASDEGGDDNTGESGGDSKRNRADSASVGSTAYISSEGTNSVSDETNDNASNEAGFTSNSKESSTKESDEHFFSENGSDSHDQTSSESPEVNSNGENSIESAESTSNISTKDYDESVSYEVMNSFGDPASKTNEGLKMSDEHSNPSSKGNDFWSSNRDMSESKSSKLVDCFRQTLNNTDCHLLRSLHSICKDQFTSKCLLGVNGVEKTKLSHSASSSSGSKSFRSFEASSESTDADDPFSDSVEASDSAMDSNSNSLSLETIENLSASYEKANGILEVIMLIKEACPSICGLAESARESTDVSNGRGSSFSPAQDSSESSDEDDLPDLSTDTYTDISNERASGHSASSQPTYTGNSSENNSVDVTIDTSSRGSSDESHYSSDASNDYSFENYSSSDNTSE